MTRNVPVRNLLAGLCWDSRGDNGDFAINFLTIIVAFAEFVPFSFKLFKPCMQLADKFNQGLEDSNGSVVILIWSCSNCSPTRQQVCRSRANLCGRRVHELQAFSSVCFLLPAAILHEISCNNFTTKNLVWLRSDLEVCTDGLQRYL